MDPLMVRHVPWNGVLADHRQQLVVVAAVMGNNKRRWLHQKRLLPTLFLSLIIELPLVLMWLRMK